jgi:phospholipid:diacylglycerol acyltransferase
MLPKGGDALWGTGADLLQRKSDNENAAEEFTRKESIFEFSDFGDGREDDQYIPICNREALVDPTTEPVVNKALKDFSSRREHTVQQAIDYLLKWGGGMGPAISSAKIHSFDPSRREKPSFRTWHDITQTPLPYAPNMKIYCLYGVGIDTERSYYYRRNPGEPLSTQDDNSSNGMGTCKIVDPPFILDTTVEDQPHSVVHGIKYADGDGSVPLLSLGYMCAGPWRNKKSGLNPSMSKVIIREYEHRPEFTVDDPMRKGHYSAEHVDILGHLDMMEDLMKIVTDYEIHTMEDKIISDIEGLVKRIDNHPLGGLPRPRRR